MISRLVRFLVVEKNLSSSLSFGQQRRRCPTSGISRSQVFRKFEAVASGFCLSQTQEQVEPSTNVVRIVLCRLALVACTEILHPLLTLS